MSYCFIDVKSIVIDLMYNEHYRSDFSSYAFCTALSFLHTYLKQIKLQLSRSKSYIITFNLLIAFTYSSMIIFYTSIYPGILVCVNLFRML